MDAYLSRKKLTITNTYESESEHIIWCLWMNLIFKKHLGIVQKYGKKENLHRGQTILKEFDDIVSRLTSNPVELIDEELINKYKAEIKEKFGVKVNTTEMFKKPNFNKVTLYTLSDYSVIAKSERFIVTCSYEFLYNVLKKIGANEAGTAEIIFY